MDINLLLPLLAVAFMVIYLGGPLLLKRKAAKAGVQLDLSRHLLGMRVRKVPMKLIVENLIRAKQVGVEIDPHTLEAHHLAGGRVERVVDAIVLARQRNIDVSLEHLYAIDFMGRDPVAAVEGGEPLSLSRT